MKYLRTGRISLHINTISLQRPAPYSSQDLYVRLSTAFCCTTLEVHVGQSQPKLYFMTNYALNQVELEWLHKRCVKSQQQQLHAKLLMNCVQIQGFTLPWKKNHVNYSQRWKILICQCCSAQNISFKNRNLSVKKTWLSSFQNRRGTQE